MSAGRVGAKIIQGALSKVRSVNTSRSVARMATPNSGVNFDDLIRTQNMRGNAADVAAELAELKRALAIEQGGARNASRDILFRQASQQESRASRLQAVAGRASAQRRVLSEGGIDSLNQQWDRAESLRRDWAKASRTPGDARKVVDFQGDVELGIPPMRGTPKQIADRMQKVKDDLERRGAKTTRSIANRERTEMKAIDKSLSAEEQATRLRGSAEAMPARTVDQGAVGRIQAKIGEREALLASLQAPTQDAAKVAVEAAAPAPKRGRRALATAGGGLAGYFAVSAGFGALEERSENMGAGDRLSTMIRGAADQRLEMLRAMAAMQRIQMGARQNLANLAMQQPHVFNEIMAGRQLAPGVVSIGGNRQEQMMRMAEVGSAMATGQFNGMGSPDALGLLNQYMQG